MLEVTCFFESVYFGDPPSKALPARVITGVTGAQECLHEGAGQLRTNDPTAEAKHVHVVVNDALGGRVRIVANGGVQALHFVGGDASANSGTTDQYAPLCIPALNGVPHLGHDIRKIDRIRRERADVDDLGTGLAHRLQDRVPEQKASMIEADRNLHLRLFTLPANLSGMS